VSTLVLVINAGSSSLKYQLIDVASEATLSKGLIERVIDHGAALRDALDRIDAEGHDLGALTAVGHRAVHGGARFSDPVVITDEVVEAITDLVPLAPLHNPATLLGIAAARQHFPDVPHVAVFDTAFHQSIPEAAHTYAVPAAWRTEHRVRRYGFHGTSIRYVTHRAAALLGREVTDTNLVVLHLGNGCSAAAIRGGRSVDTSMGLTPLEGLVMGTRSGDVDPALGAYLGRVAGLDQGAVDAALNKQSGLLGLAGVSDFREVQARRDAGDPAATLAFDVAVHRLVKYVGAYAVELGRVDGLVFTAGIGEHAAALRAAVVERLGLLGVVLDAQANAEGAGERAVSGEGSAFPVLVIPTDEELEIARQSAGLVRSSGVATSSGG
jgi:acetate kinase